MLLAGQYRLWPVFFLAVMINTTGGIILGTTTMWTVQQGAIPAHLRSTGFGIISFANTATLGLMNILAGPLLVDRIGVISAMLWVTIPSNVIALLPLAYLIQNLDLSAAFQVQVEVVDSNEDGNLS